MARLKDTILGNSGFAKGGGNANGVVDITKMQAGQNGYQPQLDGYINNTAYVRKNINAVLVEAPTGFEFLPEPELWRAALKNMVELFPNTIEGLTSTLTVESVEEAVGGAGEIQETPSNVTRERSNPSFGLTEKYGRPFNKLLNGWITNLIMDPNTKVPNIMANNDNVPRDILPDFYSMTVLFFEADPTGTRVVKAWLTTNMYPRTDGETIGSRDLTAGGETSNYSIEFGGITQVGAGVDKFAQRYLDEMLREGVNPNRKPADYASDVSEDVKAADAGLVPQTERDIVTAEPM